MLFHLFQAFVKVVEALFLIGLIGSALVLVLTTVEDFEVLIARDAPAGEAGLSAEV
ncbi:MAG TPA: hypothetical protein VFA60_08040 [Terriglobales bacterium]|nr:hypothetical protein [Terriglobales bacterium]